MLQPLVPPLSSRASPLTLSCLPLCGVRFQSVESGLTVNADHKMVETDNTSSTLEVPTNSFEGHSMGPLLGDHKHALSSVIILSLVLGLPLMLNALWHLRVSSNASGRGVLRLIKLHYCINLLSILALAIEQAILAMPAESMPSSLCLFLEWTVGFVRLNHYLGGLAIALSR